MNKTADYLKKSNFVDEIGHFWVVTKPTKNSEFIDIFFRSSIPNLLLNFKGGLKIDEIVLITKSELKARAKANELLPIKD
jgi:hypothetical protein